MPWKETRLGAMREKFVKRVLAHEKTRANYAVSTESAARPGISEYPAICPENNLKTGAAPPKSGQTRPKRNSKTRSSGTESVIRPSKPLRCAG